MLTTRDPDTTVSLGLCISDLLYPGNTPEKYERNFASFAAASVKTLRLVPAWQSTAAWEHALAPEDERHMLSAIAAGMRIKLVLSTVDAPPYRIHQDTSSRFVDENGRYSLANCISYWYSGLYDYVREALCCRLGYLKSQGLLDAVDAVVVSFGPACEPIYPADWTQNNIPGMWCYGEPARADFQRYVREKYPTINHVNQAWGTAHASYEAIWVPRPGKADGAWWNDVLLWYRDTKRQFINKQIALYQEVLRKIDGDRIRLILYMPGDAYTESQWRSSLRDSSQTATSLKVMSENEFIVQMAEKYGCDLQFTGLPMLSSVKRVVHYMHENGYAHIPVYGENTNDFYHASDPEAILSVIRDLNLAGVDYTTSQFLFENEDFITHYREGGHSYDASQFAKASGNYAIPRDAFHQLMAAIPAFTDYLRTRDPLKIPYSVSSGEASPSRHVLCYTPTAAAGRRTTQVVFKLEETILPGDMLEYDVLIPEGASGLGQIDLRFSTGLNNASGNDWICDEQGIPCRDTDLSDLSGRWVHRKIAFGIDKTWVSQMRTAGGTLKGIVLLSEISSSEILSVYLDNIVITNQGKERVLLLRNGEGQPLQRHRSLTMIDRMEE